MSAPTAWYAAFLGPEINAQERAGRYAASLGFESYVPMLTRVQKRPDRRPGIVRDRRGLVYRKEIVSSPLWARYRFIELPAAAPPFGRLTSREAIFQGYRGLVTFGDAPLVIPTREIEALREREAAGEFDATVRRGRKREMRFDSRFDVGKEVAVTGGPFRDFIARITAHVGEGRVQAEVSIFGRKTPIDIGVEQLR